MGKFIPKLISMLVPSPKKKERHDFSPKAKSESVRRQKGRCDICGAYMNRWERDFHHKDGNRSNDKLSNCRAVHTRCHRKKHSEEVHSKHHKSLLNWSIGRWSP